MNLIAPLLALRPHHWTKNLLLFVPLILAHRVADSDRVLQTAIAFAAFSLCSSFGYVLNDLLDLGADRQHPLKKNRPIASGLLPVGRGIALLPILLGLGGGLALFFLPILFSKSLGVYLAISAAYSLYLKRFPIIDVFLLSALYTWRIVAGGLASEVPFSPWLLAFSMFLFTSLAFAKRFAELRFLSEAGELQPRRRGYGAVDQAVLGTIGPTSGYLSVLVFILYLNSPEVKALYSQPLLLWLIGPFLLYWITRVWFLVHAGRMTDDPIEFTLKDPVSYAIGFVILMIAFAASGGHPII